LDYQLLLGFTMAVAGQVQIALGTQQTPQRRRLHHTFR
jgi:hypothetical protein